jgi:uncharacterized protein (DUF1697 family)
VTTYIALLRAVNVAGHQPVAMTDLREMLSQLGFEDCESLLQSGNLVFRGKLRAAAPMERLLETEARQRLGLETDFFVRTAQEWQSVVARNPFRKEAVSDPGHLIVMALKRAPDGKDVKALQAAISGAEVVRADGKHAYITYPNGVGRSRLTTALIERKLGTRGTGRNWNTVLKLAARTGV